MNLTGLFFTVLATSLGLLACASNPENLPVFEGTGLVSHWTFVELEGSPRLEGLEMTIGADGRASGSTGLNHFSGTISVDGTQLSFGPLITTRRAGSEEEMARETLFLSVLDRVDSWRREGQNVNLMARNQVVARLAKK